MLRNGTRSSMSCHLMKRTKDDESDFNKQKELHIDSVLSKIKCPEHQSKLPGEARHSIRRGLWFNYRDGLAVMLLQRKRELDGPKGSRFSANIKKSKKQQRKTFLQLETPSIPFCRMTPFKPEIVPFCTCVQPSPP